MRKKNSATTSALKRIGIISLQLLVTAAGIIYVFHDPNKRAQIAHALTQSDHHWLLLGWISYSVVELLATVRWQMLLRVQGIMLGWLRAGGIVMVGLFFNMFLPGLIGGDVMRLYYVFKLTRGKRTRATLSVAMDRLFGLLSLVFLASLSLIWRFDWLKSSRATLHITYLALGLLAAGFVLVVFLFCAVGFGLLNRLPKQLPLRETFVKSGNALNLYAKHRLVMLSAFVLTVISHLAYYLSYYCAAESLHRASWTDRDSGRHAHDHADRQHCYGRTDFIRRRRRAGDPISTIARQSGPCPAGYCRIRRIARICHSSVMVAARCGRVLAFEAIGQLSASLVQVRLRET